MIDRVHLTTEDAGAKPFPSAVFDALWSEGIIAIDEKGSAGLTPAGYAAAKAAREEATAPHPLPSPTEPAAEPDTSRPTR